MFLPHTITVSRKVKTPIRWSFSTSTTVLYSNIPAMVFKKWWDLPDTDIGQNTQKDTYNVIIENRDIQVDDVVSITLTPTFSQDDYIVTEIDYNYSKITNAVDNVYFTIKRQYA